MTRILTFIEYKRWGQEKRRLAGIVGQVNRNNTVGLMLTNEERWSAIAPSSEGILCTENSSKNFKDLMERHGSLKLVMQQHNVACISAGYRTVVPSQYPFEDFT